MTLMAGRPSPGIGPARSHTHARGGQVLRKQQINIEKLRRDNEALKTEMAMEMRNHASSKPVKHTDNITKLHDEADRYTQYVEMEKRNTFYPLPEA